MGTRPDLRAAPDNSGIWHVQGCTDRGLEWLANEVLGNPELAAVLDEDIGELVYGARVAGLVVLVDAPPLGAV